MQVARQLVGSVMGRLLGRLLERLVRRMAAVGLVLVALSVATAQEWSVSVPCGGGVTQTIALPLDALGGADALHWSWQVSGADLDRSAPDRWCEVAVVTADGRWFTCAQPPLVAPGASGQVQWRLDQQTWSGNAGTFSGDAAAAVASLVVRVHGPASSETLTGTMRVDSDHALGALRIEQVGSGLWSRTFADGRLAWHEWRFRLIGDPRAETGQVIVSNDQGAAGGDMPAFVYQTMVTSVQGLRPYGPPCWTVRLRPDELGRAVVVNWSDAEGHTWASERLSMPTAISNAEALPAKITTSYPWPMVPAWSEIAALWDRGTWWRTPGIHVPQAWAPILRWQQQWTGFRGVDCTSHVQAWAMDGYIATQPVTTIDVLPRGLCEEQGTFRFGLHPLHVDGTVDEPQDVWHVSSWQTSAIAHAREIMARARAVPTLRAWTIGNDIPMESAEDMVRVRQVCAAIAGEAGPTSIISRHSAVVAYAYRAEDPPWNTFDTSIEGWGAARIPGLGRPDREAVSVSNFALRLPLMQVGNATFGAVEKIIDANVVNLDRLQWDIRCDGPPGSSVQCFAYATDRFHRWYQAVVARVPSSTRWSTIGIDLDDAAVAWQPVGHNEPWTGDQRRQLRRFGIVAWIHGGTPDTAKVWIDTVTRLGWPTQPTPQFDIQDIIVSQLPSAKSTPIAVDFTLPVAAKNPYDPDTADVIGEAIAPDGRTIRFPAFWYEPMTVAMVDGTEQVTPNGAGHWRWRFSPPTAGAWKWRLRARIMWRDQWLTADSEWTTTNVADTWPSMPPVYPDKKDPLWWSKADGSFWYPMGLNIRSPGDTRQDRVLAAYAQGKPRANPNANVLTDPLPGWTSAQWDQLGTVAFERWFKQCQTNHINWARVWMCPWWCGLEWTRQWDEYGGLVMYNQHAAARLDRIMELAGKYQVYVQLELQNHGMTSERVDQQWNRDRDGNFGSPYSRRNGGPCNGPEDFFRDPDVWNTHTKRLRYTLARWGAQREIAAFVLSSEMEFTGDWWVSGAFQDEDNGHAAATQEWVNKSLAYFKEHDPQQRAVTVHFSHPWRASRLWQTPGLGFSNSNAYTGFQVAMQRLGGPRAGLDRAFEVYLAEHFPPWRLKRPTLIGEWGGHWDRNTPEQLLAELHTGVWMQAVMPYGGNTGYWWWLFMDATDTWSEFARVAKFIDGHDPRGQQWTLDRPRCSTRDIRAIGMACAKEIRTYVWQKNYDRSLDQAPLADAGTLSCNGGVANAVWAWERWNTHTGTIDQRGEATAGVDGRINLTLGELNGDAAFMLTRKR